MVRVIMIVEMAGRPAEHLKESLEKHVGVLNQVNDIKVDRIEISEPRMIESSLGKEIPKEQEMFTSFAECEFNIPNFARLSETMFDFMPSSVEIVEPANVSLSAAEATDLLNNISGRMHRYDEIAKIAGERLKFMDSQLKMAQKILIDRDKKISELSKVKENSSKKKAVKKTSKKKASKKKAVKK